MNTIKKSLKTEYDYIDVIKFAFEKQTNNKVSFVDISIDWTYPENDDDIIYLENDASKYHSSYLFNCGECNTKINIKELKVRDRKFACTNCGHTHSLDDLAPYMIKETSYSTETKIAVFMHNVANGTKDKYNVPTIVADYKEFFFYCPDCHKTHSVYDLEKENNIVSCKCGSSFTFDECKIVIGRTQRKFTNGGLYFDGHKISISLLTSYTDITRNNQYYWSLGNKRATLNLETGYSYLTHKGHEYTLFNKEWAKLKTGKAPALFNATYCNYVWTQLDEYASVKVNLLFDKYKAFPNLLKLINKNFRKIEDKILKKTIKQIDDYMTIYYNKKFNYRIKSLEEIVSESKEHKSLMDIPHYERLHLLVLHNRFINANYYDLIRNLSVILDDARFSRVGNKVFRKMHRESNYPIIDFVSALVPISKSLKKRILADYINFHSKNIKLYWSSSIFSFVRIASFFKKKENVNKLYNLCTSTSTNILNTDTDFMSLWISLRNEEYIANLKSFKDVRDKANLMVDSARLLNQIKYVYGEDWTCPITFHNEKQFHDALITIIRSDTFKSVQDAKRKEELSVPFKMEQSIFELSNKNISIALNEWELVNIGNEMHICVGGYGNAVKNSNCRIAYIQEDNEFKACLELRVTKIDKEFVYTLKQAKLKYNNYVGTNEKYHKLVSEWCESNNIKIDTYDMDPKYENKTIEM